MEHPRDRYLTVYGRKPVLEVLEQPERAIARVRGHEDPRDGAMIRGWVRHVDLRAAEDARVVERPFRRSTEHSRHALCRRRPPRQDEYVGPAHITVGTLVHTSRDGTEWASVSEPSIFTVSWRPGDRWVRVVHVPGLRGDGRCAEVIRRAWVPRSAVSLQGERSSGILLGLE